MIRSLRRGLESYWSRLVYYWLGPTTVHYRLEALLLVCLTLATVANLQSVAAPPHAGWTWDGDGIYTALVFLWLSRHLLLRWLCLWDTSTTIRSPTLLGCVSMFLTSYASSGHAFERPSQAANNYLLTGSATPGLILLANISPGSGGGGGGGGGIGGGLGGIGGSSSTLLLHNGQIKFSHLLPTGWTYFVQWILNCCWYPFLRPVLGPALSTVNTHVLSIPMALVGFAEDKTGWNIARFCSNQWQSWKQALLSFYLQYGPTLPFLLPGAVLIFYGTQWYTVLSLVQSGTSLPSTITSLNKRTAAVIQDEQEASKAFGAYVRSMPPSWWHVMLVIATLGTSAGLWTVLYFRRVFVPLPDQAAGSSVVRDWGGAGGGGKLSGASKASSSRNKDLDLLTAWPERTRPLEGRIDLEWKVRLFRLAEAVLLCGILPRMTWLCRATGHCPPPRLWELTHLLYPIGISTPLRKDGVYSPVLFAGSWASGVWILIVISILTVLILLAQAVILNKTYLAIQQYVATEWDPVEVLPPSEKATTPSSSSPSATTNSSSTTPPAWDPRRRYKTGDMVVYPTTGPRRVVYRATTNGPEGEPASESPSRIENALSMRTELGHPISSALLWRISAFQCFMVILEAALLVLRTSIGGSAAVNGGAYTRLLAQAVAAVGLVRVGLPRYSRLSRLNDEIYSSNSVAT
jgi:hypothetical protein